MPELPEVETTRRGLSKYILAKKITRIDIRQRQLRWEIPTDLSVHLVQKELLSIDRRAKYLLLNFNSGTLLIHLGMSGSLRVCNLNTPPEKHDHADFIFDSCLLRYTDPRRFGAILWLGSDPYAHKLLSHLGVEPLTEQFSGEYLHHLSKRRKLPVKQFIMDQKVVTGVGNIYATEALFLSALRPTRSASQISLARYQRLVLEIKKVLILAIEQGGTTLKDFVGGDGKPGYFQQTLHIYGKAGAPCPSCQKPLDAIKLAGRNSVFCAHCQT
ncbi:formamidopyrimidine-DNA glycosylase [Psychromonas sp. CNPT3]|uniref:bifunctional DNA-formamidopyrimidine glycosylase/DNA-(apurinic or apyrimidinic site) lyase n=1 Tax=Psychromonas sp. CNPT3 TaxID=314282 RepID=UPI00006E50B4|nr:bifunctional DNA-formamidopyrimidine glycosylase/DNA-(apurinic or apyrimidinic site) lyase [Psychromonas sp. CNPT3]AGH80012.1 formamidopyrimidine-DNA glycosylase [Psychromonas sp. CNPT3]